MRRVVIGLLAGVLLGASAPAAQAVETGLSDGRAAMLDAPTYATTNFTRTRLVLPWNAASTRGSWDAWLQRAAALGAPVMIAPNIDPASNCTGGACRAPGVAAYAAELRVLLARYPNIDAVEAWNEPNHAMQPTARDAGLAAAYFDAAHDACANRCIAVAGNMLDVLSMPGYLAEYRRALRRVPAVWGVHNYYDATYFADEGVRAMLAIGDGPVWLTETGGLVTFRPPQGPGLPYDEARAADSLRWLYTLAASHPRIERIYLYGLWQEPQNPFDSGLLRVDGAERPSMGVVRGYVGRRPVAGPSSPVGGAEDVGPVAGPTPSVVPGATDRGTDRGSGVGGGSGAAAGVVAGGDPRNGGTSTLYVVGKRIVVPAAGRTVVRVRCVGASRCAGRVELRAGRWKTVRQIGLRGWSSGRVTVQVPRAARRRLGTTRRTDAWVRLCAARACSARLAVVRR